MKAFECTFKVSEEGKVVFPDSLTKLLPKNEELRCIILVDEGNEKEIRTSITEMKTQEFFYGLPVQTGIYDDF